IAPRPISSAALPLDHARTTRSSRPRAETLAFDRIGPRSRYARYAGCRGSGRCPQLQAMARGLHGRLRHMGCVLLCISKIAARLAGLLDGVGSAILTTG